MSNIKIINDIENILYDEEYINCDIKFGYLYNNVLKYNINNNFFDKFKQFINNKYKVQKINNNIYYYYDMILISRDENSHICKRISESKFKYYNFKKNKLAFQFKMTNNKIIDNIEFPCVEKYHNQENITIDEYPVKFKNSTINIQFININNNVNSIKLKFKVNKNNLDNFKNNLSFILSKLYREKVFL